MGEKQKTLRQRDWYLGIRFEISYVNIPENLHRGFRDRILSMCLEQGESYFMADFLFDVVRKSLC